MTMWMASGNPHEPDYSNTGAPIVENQSYTYHPNYRGLVLRKNFEDLKAWIREARKYYAYFGGEYIDREFRFPSGAVIWTGHLDDENAYEKYMGIPELHRLAIEEACQIPSLELYMQVLACVRSSTPCLRCQVFLTANPIGPGLFWMRDRFVRVKDEKGKPIPPKTRIVEKLTNPYNGEEMEIDRIFIPSGLRDNPHCMKDQTYLANLMRLPEKLRKAYLEGDWDAMVGTFFDFRPEGPAIGEPDNANHVIGPRNTERRREKGRKVADFDGYPQIQPWWPHAIGGDWGYSHVTAFYWGARDPDTGQVHVYREMVLNETGLETLGVKLANDCYEELMSLPDNAITLWFSRDAFAKRNDDQGVKSLVEVLARGIGSVVGPDAVHVPEIEISEAEDLHMRPGLSENFMKTFHDWKDKLLKQRNAGITIRKCNSNRILGWNYIRDLLNWNPPIRPNTEAFNYDFYMKLAREYNAERAERYRQMFNNQRAYPELQIWEQACPRLVDAIPEAQHAIKNPEDIEKTEKPSDDMLDALRYLLLGLQEPLTAPPFEVHRQKKLAQFKARHPDAGADDLIWVHDFLNEEEARRNASESLVIPRSATDRRRRMRQQWKRKAGKLVN